MTDGDGSAGRSSGRAALAPALSFVHRPARAASAPRVVLLHGFMGLANDLAPFAASLGVDAEYIFPHGIIDLEPGGGRGRGWWSVDAPGRAQAIARGPRDLSDFSPDGLDRARTCLAATLDDLDVGWASPAMRRPLVLGGFSQGAMLACDVVLRTARPFAGLVLFSGAPITRGAWRALYGARRALPVFISHGRRDEDLSFSVAESFRGELAAAGWNVTWAPFDGGHEIPLAVWRAFKRWLADRSESSPAPAR